MNKYCQSVSQSVGNSLLCLFFQVKTHLQSRSNADIAVGHQHPHSRMSEAFTNIFKNYGIRGLWRGATASMTRVTIGSSIQLATFSHAKSLIDKYNVR